MIAHSRWIHETDCPRHSNMPGAQSETNLSFGFNLLRVQDRCDGGLPLGPACANWKYSHAACMAQRRGMPAEAPQHPYRREGPAVSPAPRRASQPTMSDIMQNRRDLRYTTTQACQARQQGITFGVGYAGIQPHHVMSQRPSPEHRIIPCS